MAIPSKTTLAAQARFPLRRFVVTSLAPLPNWRDGRQSSPA
jgi:hypothetical protein